MKASPFAESRNKDDHDVNSKERLLFGDKLDRRQGRALSLGLAQRHIAVVRLADKWRGEQRRVQAFVFGHFSAVARAKSSFLARINPYLAEVKFSYPRLNLERLLS